MFEELGEGGKKNELLVADDPGNKKFRNLTEIFADKPSTSLGPIAQGGGKHEELYSNKTLCLTRNWRWEGEPVIGQETLQKC